MNNFENSKLDSLEKKFSGKFKCFDYTVDPSNNDAICTIELTPDQVQFLNKNWDAINAKRISIEWFLSQYSPIKCVDTTKLSLTGNLLTIRGRDFVVSAILEMIYNKRI